MVDKSSPYTHYLSSMALAWQQPHWQPAVDIYRTRTGWLLKVELAGVRVEDIELHATGTSLILRGLRYDWMIEDVCDSYSLEIAYNRFERTLQLPCEIDPTLIQSEYRDGMLLIRIPECKE
jgi:HSP20 family protein